MPLLGNHYARKQPSCEKAPFIPLGILESLLSIIKGSEDRSIDFYL
jgi:hypothetical protein